MSPTCLTLHLLSSAPPLRPPTFPPPGTSLQDRDPYDLPSAAYATHFALRWGEPSPLSGGDVARILDSLEISWDLFVETWALPAPEGTDSHYLNVYIGDTGGPASYGAYGYYSRDPEGWPMLVLSPEMVTQADQSLTTLPHELFHAIQDRTGSFADSREYGWFWESTAVWVEGVLYPEDPLASVFLFGYAFQPHLPLDLYVSFSAGDITEYRAYGAGIFHRYLDEHQGARDHILQAWRDPADPSDPLANLPVSDVFLDFAAHNATWDYAAPEILTTYLEHYADDPSFSAQDTRVVVDVEPAGTGAEWVSPPAVTLPSALGYNVIRWASPPPGRARVEVELTDSLVARVVLRDAARASAARYAAPGEVEVRPGESLWLVVAALEAPEGEAAAYRYRLVPDDAEADSGGGGGGGGDDTGAEGRRACGCQGAAGGGVAGMWGGVVWGGLLRRRIGRGAGGQGRRRRGAGARARREGGRPPR